MISESEQQLPLILINCKISKSKICSLSTSGEEGYYLPQQRVEFRRGSAFPHSASLSKRSSSQSQPRGDNIVALQQRNLQTPVLKRSQMPNLVSSPAESYANLNIHEYSRNFTLFTKIYQNNFCVLRIFNRPLTAFELNLVKQSYQVQKHVPYSLIKLLFNQSLPQIHSQVPDLLLKTSEQADLDADLLKTSEYFHLSLLKQNLCGSVNIQQMNQKFSDIVFDTYLIQQLNELFNCSFELNQINIQLVRVKNTRELFRIFTEQLNKAKITHKIVKFSQQLQVLKSVINILKLVLKGVLKRDDVREYLEPIQFVNKCQLALIGNIGIKDDRHSLLKQCQEAIQTIIQL
ncbi:Hypothetical_protein [Hexamita inflata]|uniref:Hypothetical_protein n=1 Tax=Hexamita inflata TaxID=28002 RepID=A0AA86QIL6_9EUKA|nr:Hypothetical protein HINF_LOCUS41544 [Hexamita inflata]